MIEHKRKRLIAALAATAIIVSVAIFALRVRPPVSLEYDPAYWTAKNLKMDSWYWGITPSGIIYNLYIPPAVDSDDVIARVPLIVCFHGNSGKAIVKDQYGRLFTDPRVQARFSPSGIAVLAVQSRIEYFSDPHAYARLIKNVALQHKCIDPERIAGYGFSQGAAFVQELAMYDPSLFKAVASGSSYYSASLPELFRAARVRFWCATSRNDKGIYEQGHTTGQILAAICPDSRYVEYETRGHFFIEPSDTSGKGGETFTDWLCSALSPRAIRETR